MNSKLKIINNLGTVLKAIMFENKYFFPREFLLFMFIQVIKPQNIANHNGFVKTHSKKIERNPNKKEKLAIVRHKLITHISNSIDINGLIQSNNISYKTNNIIYK